MLHGPPPNINVLRVLVLALFMGMAMLTGVFTWMRLSGTGAPAAPPPNQEIYMYVLGAIAFGAVSGAIIIPAALVRQSAHVYRGAASDAERDAIVTRLFGTTTILRCAMVEAVGLFGAVVYFLTGETGFLAAPILAGLCMLAFFPTRGKVESLRRKLERAMD